MGQVFDRVKETTSTTGTGSITLAGAATGFRTFNDGAGLNVDFYYALIDANGTGWETGRGYLSGATTLVRDAVHESSNAGAAINLSAGTHSVFITATEDLFSGIPGKVYAVARGWDAP